ncbi:hypothetical protein GPECTOR_12g392 [Gonium pectorale]|uniref:Uncharacterized protein n=1 Tax=Gonium pectorale TaxID=33097 RepID=A0A150GQ20_GONPE|nr:hypothetical protein GPECTOR_12g392 [Gonium pectorale]|eukprot:KXZ51430.1 hypothetical protein GPECTOR_12g392 [Gonium pectorale]
MGKAVAQRDSSASFSFSGSDLSGSIDIDYGGGRPGAKPTPGGKPDSGRPVTRVGPVSSAGRAAPPRPTVPPPRGAPASRLSDSLSISGGSDDLLGDLEIEHSGPIGGSASRRPPYASPVTSGRPPSAAGSRAGSGAATPVRPGSGAATPVRAGGLLPAGGALSAIGGASGRREAMVEVLSLDGPKPSKTNIRRDALSQQPIRESTHTVAMSEADSIDLSGSGSIAIEHSEELQEALTRRGQNVKPIGGTVAAVRAQASRLSASISGSIDFSDADSGSVLMIDAGRKVGAAAGGGARTGGAGGGARGSHGGSDLSISLSGSSINIVGSDVLEVGGGAGGRPGAGGGGGKQAGGKQAGGGAGRGSDGGSDLSISLSGSSINIVGSIGSELVLEATDRNMGVGGGVGGGGRPPSRRPPPAPKLERTQTPSLSGSSFDDSSASEKQVPVPKAPMTAASSFQPAASSGGTGPGFGSMRGSRQPSVGSLTAMPAFASGVSHSDSTPSLSDSDSGGGGRRGTGRAGPGTAAAAAGGGSLLGSMRAVGSRAAAASGGGSSSDGGGTTRPKLLMADSLEDMLAAPEAAETPTGIRHTYGTYDDSYDIGASGGGAAARGGDGGGSGSVGDISGSIVNSWEEGRPAAKAPAAAKRASTSIELSSSNLSLEPSETDSPVLPTGLHRRTGGGGVGAMPGGPAIPAGRASERSRRAPESGGMSSHRSSTSSASSYAGGARGLGAQDLRAATAVDVKAAAATRGVSQQPSSLSISSLLSDVLDTEPSNAPAPAPAPAAAAVNRSKSSSSSGTSLSISGLSSGSRGKRKQASSSGGSGGKGSDSESSGRPRSPPRSTLLTIDALEAASLGSEPSAASAQTAPKSSSSDELDLSGLEPQEKRAPAPMPAPGPSSRPALASVGSGSRSVSLSDDGGAAPVATGRAPPGGSGKAGSSSAFSTASSSGRAPRRPALGAASVRAGGSGRDREEEESSLSSGLRRPASPPSTDHSTARLGTAAAADDEGDDYGDYEDDFVSESVATESVAASRVVSRTTSRVLSRADSSLRADSIRRRAGAGGDRSEPSFSHQASGLGGGPHLRPQTIAESTSSGSESPTSSRRGATGSSSRKGKGLRRRSDDSGDGVRSSTGDRAATDPRPAPPGKLQLQQSRGRVPDPRVGASPGASGSIGTVEEEDDLLAAGVRARGSGWVAHQGDESDRSSPSLGHGAGTDTDLASPSGTQDPSRSLLSQSGNLGAAAVAPGWAAFPAHKGGGGGAAHGTASRGGGTGVAGDSLQFSRDSDLSEEFIPSQAMQRNLLSEQPVFKPLMPYSTSPRASSAAGVGGPPAFTARGVVDASTGLSPLGPQHQVQQQPRSPPPPPPPPLPPAVAAAASPPPARGVFAATQTDVYTHVVDLDPIPRPGTVKLRTVATQWGTLNEAATQVAYDPAAERLLDPSGGLQVPGLEPLQEAALPAPLRAQLHRHLMMQQQLHGPFSKPRGGLAGVGGSPGLLQVSGCS